MPPIIRLLTRRAIGRQAAKTGIIHFRYTPCESSAVSLTKIAGQIAGSIGVPIVHASQNIVRLLPHTQAIIDTLLERARHMPAGDSITVTIICETIPDNEPSAACVGSGSECRRSLPPIKLSKTQDSRTTPKTRTVSMQYV